MHTAEEFKKGEKRARLTEAAEALFYQQGVHHTNTADIAQKLRFHLAIFYYHFRTKNC